MRELARSAKSVTAAGSSLGVKSRWASEACRAEIRKNLQLQSDFSAPRVVRSSNA
jgi:hypothetical protein